MMTALVVQVLALEAQELELVVKVLVPVVQVLELAVEPLWVLAVEVELAVHQTQRRERDCQVPSRPYSGSSCRI